VTQTNDETRTGPQEKIHINETMRRNAFPRKQITTTDFDRQVAEIQVRIAVLSGFTSIGTPVMEAVG
jgi:hypothetical protein